MKEKHVLLGALVAVIAGFLWMPVVLTLVIADPNGMPRWLMMRWAPIGTLISVSVSLGFVGYVLRRSWPDL